MMEYIKLFWEDAPEGEPSVILYEVDTENERLALHSIDIFADGRTRNIIIAATAQQGREMIVFHNQIIKLNRYVLEFLRNFQCREEIH